MGPLGFQEIVIIFIIALIVFGPKKLPELGKSLGKGLREFKRATEDLKTNFDEHIRDAEHSLEEVKHSVTETSNEIQSGLDAPPENVEKVEKAAEPQEPSNEPIHPK